MSLCPMLFFTAALVAAENEKAMTVGVGLKSIFIDFPQRGGGRVRVLELRPYQAYAPGQKLPVCWESQPANEAVVFTRFVENRDRLYSKFQLVDAASGKASGAPQWVTDFSRLPGEPAAFDWPKSIKGVTCPVGLADLKDLGVKYANTNIDLTRIFAFDAGDLAVAREPRDTWEVDGERLPLNMDYLRGMDRQIKTMTDMGINVHLIIGNYCKRLPAGHRLRHPATDFGAGAMGLGAFNLTDEPGLRAYRAAVELMARRWSRADGKYGRVAGYIVGNEVQQHWAWWNLGRLPRDEALEHYHRALRVTHLALQKERSAARVYVSMDHHWRKLGHLNDPLREIPGDFLIEKMNALSKAGGDFPWHVAFHPYPESLFKPAFWNDRTALLNFHSPRITFKNLEVLPAFLNQERLRYGGKARRIILSEQGFHTPDGPDGEQLQAAAYAAAYYRTSRLDGIDAFMLHRHVDHRGEGGLKLGLWTNDPNSSSASAPGRKKLSWEVFRQADTPQWEQAFAFAKPLVGIASWDELNPVGADEIGRQAPFADADDAVYDLYKNMRKAKVENAADWRTETVVVAGGWPMPSIFHHPPSQGASMAVFEVALPKQQRGRSLALTFYTAFTGPTHNGARFAVAIDGREIWQTTQTAQAPASHAIDLTAWAGKTIRLALIVDALGNTSHDWCNWVQPRVAWSEGE